MSHHPEPGVLRNCFSVRCVLAGQKPRPKRTVRGDGDLLADAKREQLILAPSGFGKKAVAEAALAEAGDSTMMLDDLAQRPPEAELFKKLGACPLDSD